MAMRALLRSAAGRCWASRSAAAASNLCSPPSRECQSDVSSSAITNATWLPRSPRISCWTGPSSNSLSESFLPSSSSSSSKFLRIPSHVSSFLISTPSVAPLSSYTAAMHRSLADLRPYSGPVGAQNPSALPALMQQRRTLSKLKKYKIKPYSSYKERFKLMADGTYKRWRSGTRHNAHSKTPKQRRQLRRPSVAPAALATIMKKLNFVR